MSNEMVALTNVSFEGSTIRMFGTKYDPWFVGIDVATALGYKRPRDAISRHVDKDDSVIRGVIDALGRMQETILINESGMYALIFGSDLPEAKRFKRWVTHEVLPSIRKYGHYNTSKRGRPALAESNGVTKEGLIAQAASWGMRVVDAKKLERSELVKFCEERSDPEWIEANYDNYPYSYFSLNAEVGGLLSLVLLHVRGLENYAMCTGGVGREDMRFTQEFKDKLPVFAKKAKVEMSCRA
mgnify:CR=1 FL=1